MLAHDPHTTTMVALIITVYNRVDALSAVLNSVARQTTAPDELLIADDGSNAETVSWIRAQSHRWPHFKHVWQEDIGFRPGTIRNKAAAQSKADYLIFIDGDMLLHPRFVEDHVTCAKPNQFIQGTRALCKQKLTRKVLSDNSFTFRPCIRGSKMQYAIRSKILSKFASEILTEKPKKIHGCNWSIHRDSFYASNGFDERIHTLGPKVSGEDQELARRLMQSGMTELKLRYRALALHLWHPVRENWADVPDTDMQPPVDGVSKYLMQEE